MSKYTTEVRFICESYAGLSASEGGNNVENVIQDALPKIFDFDFPIFDETYRNVLETKIIKHYYTREIGEETVSLWKFRLNTTLNEIMPYYNKLYMSELLEFNPLYDVDYTRTGDRTGQETGEGTSASTDRMTGTVTDAGTHSSTDAMTGTVRDQGTDGSTTSGTTTHGGTDTRTLTGGKKNDHWDYYSDTPQGTIGAVPGGGAEALSGHTYLTNVRHITDDETGSSSTDRLQHGETITTAATTEGESDSTKTYNTTNTGQGTSGNTKTYNTQNAITGNTTNSVNNTEEYAEHVSGRMHTSGSKLLLEFRNTLLNIDMMIIKDLRPLFFGLWE